MFVLRNYFLDKDKSYLFSSYMETTRSRKTCLNGKEATTIFLNNKNSAKRAVLLGWVDETEEYNKALEEEQEKIEKEKPKKRGRPKSKSK